jgi:hypothetical protein
MVIASGSVVMMTLSAGDVVFDLYFAGKVN